MDYYHLITPLPKLLSLVIDIPSHQISETPNGITSFAAVESKSHKLIRMAYLTRVSLAVGVASTQEAGDDVLGVSCRVEHFLAHRVLNNGHLNLLQHTRYSTA